MLQRWRSVRVLGFMFSLGAACGCAADEHATSAPEPAVPYGTWGDPLGYLPHGAQMTALSCARQADDLVHDVLCAPDRAPITSLVELEHLFGFDAERIGGYTGVTVTSHSTALGTRSVSAINPRVLLLRLEFPGLPMVVIGFARGEQLVELVVRDRTTQELHFYLVQYRQACNAAAEGCRPGDLVTPATEEGWTGLGLYDEASLTNTTLDCATCHQTDGPGTPKLLRMQEIDAPWTHWFFAGTAGGRALIEDYLALHGDEIYAGLPRRRIEYSTASALPMLTSYVTPGPQPNRFDSTSIESEVEQSAAARGGNQPRDNSVPGESPTWQALYEVAMRGEAIPVPYHDVKVTDPQKLARMTAAYQAFTRGELAREELPDIRDVFPDDPRLLAHMGVGTEPGLSGEGVLLQACSQCHNERLDQSLSRARFRADLSGMSRLEKDAAIQRLKLPTTHPLAMPPSRLRMLTPEARARAIEALSR